MRFGLFTALAAAQIAAVVIEPPTPPVPTIGPEDGAPPRRLRLTRETRALARKVGILFDGQQRSDVLAYDADDGWIEIQNHEGRLFGPVEPYWRHPPTVEPPRVPELQASTEARAEAKRARKAAKRLGRAA